MKLQKTEHKKNPLLKRDEYVFLLDHSGKPTPSRQEILKDLAKELKASEDAIVIDKIISKPGSSVSDAKVLVYKKKEDIPKGKLEKMTPKKKAAEASSEKPPEEETSEKEQKAEEEKTGEEKPEGSAEPEKEEPKSEEKQEEEKKE